VITSLGFLLDIDRPQDLAVAARHPRGAWLTESAAPGTARMTALLLSNSAKSSHAQ